jgi:cohesin loading factor subunit SCC2
MLRPIITKAVSSRLTDDSISVREAALSLVGIHVVNSPAVANSFQASLRACLSDEGISVRKRAIKIYQSILTTNPSFKGRSAVCDMMLQRAADPKEEDGVRDLIHDLFSTLWLQDGNAKVGMTRSVATSPTPSPGTRRSLWTPQKRADVAAEQMMEVVRAGGSSDHLEKLLHQLLKNVKRGRQECENIVNSLFELLVAIEEPRQANGSRIGKDLAATLQTIATLAEIAPQIVYKHLETCLPFLTGDNAVPMDDNASIVAATSDIIYRLTQTPDVPHEMYQLVSTASVARDLAKIPERFGPAASESAVRALSSVIKNHQAGDKCPLAQNLFELARKYYSFLHKKLHIQDFSSENVSEMQATR